MVTEHVKLVVESGNVVEAGISKFHYDISDLREVLKGKSDVEAIAFIARYGFEVLNILGHQEQRLSNSQPPEGMVDLVGGYTQEVWVTEIWLIRRR